MTASFPRLISLIHCAAESEGDAGVSAGEHGGDDDADAAPSPLETRQYALRAGRHQEPPADHRPQPEHQLLR